MLRMKDGGFGHGGDLFWGASTPVRILSAHVLVEVGVSHVSLGNEVDEVNPGQFLIGGPTLID